MFYIHVELNSPVRVSNWRRWNSSWASFLLDTLTLFSHSGLQQPPLMLCSSQLLPGLIQPSSEGPHLHLEFTLLLLSAPLENEEGGASTSIGFWAGWRCFMGLKYVRYVQRDREKVGAGG
ncbi:hypothetical protein INR49_017369 [Caranx melampygus]|nr:hypothetical protein INR49_017369 [Caranx melampygus]